MPRFNSSLVDAMPSLNFSVYFLKAQSGERRAKWNDYCCFVRRAEQLCNDETKKIKRIFPASTFDDVVEKLLDVPSSLEKMEDLKRQLSSATLA